MNKCFITKLDVAVNEGDTYFNQFRFIVPANTNVMIPVGADSPDKVVYSIDNGGYFTSLNGETNFGMSLVANDIVENPDADNNFKMITGSKDATLVIKNVQCIRRFGLPTNCTPIGDFSWEKIKPLKLQYFTSCPWGEEFNIAAFTNSADIYTASLNLSSTYITGDIASLATLVNVRELNLTGTNIYGDIKDISTAKNVGILSVYDTKVHGNISSIGSLINIVDLAPSILISGTIESFAESQIANGRNSGKIEFRFNGVITQNGEVIPNGTKKNIVFNGSSYSIT